MNKIRKLLSQIEDTTLRQNLRDAIQNEINVHELAADPQAVAMQASELLQLKKRLQHYNVMLQHRHAVLEPVQKAFMDALYAKAGRENVVFVSDFELADELQITQSSVKRALLRLERVGFIIYKRGHPEKRRVDLLARRDDLPLEGAA